MAIFPDSSSFRVIRKGCILCGTASILFLNGCQTINQEPVSAARFEELAPFDLAINAGDEPLIDLTAGMNDAMMMMAYQGGAVGGALGSLASELGAMKRRGERKEALGETWEAFVALDERDLLGIALERNDQADHSYPWISRITPVEGLSDAKMESFAMETGRPSMAVESYMLFSADLTSIAFHVKYLGYWSESPQEKPAQQTAGKVNHVVFLDRMGLDLEENGAAWGSRINDVRDFAVNHLMEAVEVMRYDVSRLDRVDTSRREDLRNIWGISGFLEDVLPEGRLVLRNYNQELYSIPEPPIVHRRLERVAILRGSGEGKTDLSAFLKSELEASGFEASLVDHAEEASGAEALIRIYPDWGSDMGIKILKSVSVSIIDATSGELLGYATHDPGMSMYRAASMEEAVMECWDLAYARDLARVLQAMER